MITLITGGSGSGKSACAEKFIAAISEGKKKYYIATMQAYDSEALKKIERHQRQRSGKGFETIEQPHDIHKAAEKMADGEKTALLECISNLAANEMFDDRKPAPENVSGSSEPAPAEAVADKIIKGIKDLESGLSQLVIVTNNVFEDGIVYDKTTMEYIAAMGAVNQRLAAMADKVIEVVAGIPVVIK